MTPMILMAVAGGIIVRLARSTRTRYVLRVRSLVILGLLAAGAACGGGSDPDPCLDAPTYTNKIGPLVEMKCLGCHKEELLGMMRNGAPDNLNFDNYALAMPHFEQMVSEISSGREPPPTLDPPIVVTQEERELVRDWRDCGYRK